MQTFIMQNQWIVLILIIWSIPWKGFALWKAARNSQKIWFIALLIINTFAILEIIYLIFFSKKKNYEEGDGRMDNGDQNNGSVRKII